jgi:hypothetical protein
MSPRTRTKITTAVGLVMLVYALWPPGEPEWLTVAGGMLGLGPVGEAAQKGPTE